jgi:hypothetical protein
MLWRWPFAGGRSSVVHLPSVCPSLAVDDAPDKIRYAARMRTLRLLLVFCLLSLLAAPSVRAGNYVTLSCPDRSFSQRFMVGTGRQFRGQGIELWPMLCTATGRFADYPRVGDVQRFARLEALARRPVSDSVLVRDVLDLSAELGDTSLATMFDQTDGLTFGDIRSSVANTARDTGKRLGSTHYTAWTQPTCAGFLIPFDYYLDTGAACPACGTASLVIDSSDRTEWE